MFHKAGITFHVRVNSSYQPAVFFFPVFKSPYSESGWRWFSVGRPQRQPSTIRKTAGSMDSPRVPSKCDPVRIPMNEIVPASMALGNLISRVDLLQYLCKVKFWRQLFGLLLNKCRLEASFLTLGVIKS